MDATLFLVSAYDPQNITEADYLSWLGQDFGSSAGLIASRYPVAAFNNTPLPPFYARVTVLTESSFKCPAYRGLTGAIANGIPAFTYSFNHTPSCSWESGIPQDALDILGPTHTAELPFVFANLFDLPLPNGTCNMTTSEQSISANMVSAWSAMAVDGNPSSERLQWPAFDLQDSLGINVRNTTIVGSIDYSSCSFWDAILAAQLKNATYLNNLTASNGTTGTSNATGSVFPTGGPSVSPSTFTGQAGVDRGASALLIKILVAALTSSMLL